MFGKHNSFVSEARVSACMYFLVKYVIESLTSHGYKQNEISQELRWE